MRHAPIDTTRQPRPSHASTLVLATFAVLFWACAPVDDRAPSSPTDEDGFPPGSYAKEIDDPDAGRVRLVWTFEAGGRWAEVPFALDGQTSIFPPVRGTWTVDGETITLATDFPPDWGTSRHAWRLDGDRIWTTYQSSDSPDDAAWFATLDLQPWVRVE